MKGGGLRPDTTTSQGRAAFCEGKAGMSFDDAAAVCRRTGRSKSRDKRRVVYRCPFCRLWHIGTPPPKSVRRW